MKKRVMHRNRSIELNNTLFIDRILATEISNSGNTGGWTEAIALERFLDETVYAAICHGMRKSIRILLFEKQFCLLRSY